MFDIGFSEMLVIGAIALIAIGPEQLPELARRLGRLVADIKSSTSSFTSGFQDVRNQAEQMLDFERATKPTVDDTRAAAEQAFSDAANAIPTPSFSPGPQAADSLKAPANSDDKPTG